MTPKFTPLDEAAEKLGVSKDTLNALREQGSLRAYRDGASWKFRTDDIEKMVEEGVPSIDPGSELDIDFDLDDDLKLDDLSLGDGSDDKPVEVTGPADDDLELAPLDAPLELDLEPAEVAEVPEEFSLEEPLAADLTEEDDDESILLGEMDDPDGERSPSTIIGKEELELAIDPESDLKLTDDSVATSDVRLADPEELEVASGSDAGPGSDFDEIEELELDLEAESSRVLAPEDLEAAQQAAQEKQQTPETSDLQLEDDFELASTSDAGLTGLSALELEGSKAGSEIDLTASGDEGGDKASGAGLTGLSALELEDEDDFVLGDGSDITLGSGDSGINLTPSDSGLSLDDPSLAGSAIGSALDLGSQIGAAGGSGSMAGISGLGEQGFELSPVSEADAVEDEEDSSQVIALDAFEDSQQADDLLGDGAAAEYTPAAAAPAAMGAVATPQPEQQFGAGVVFFLSTCVLMLSLCGIMVFDIVRNMWSWEEPYSLNSSLIDGLTGLFF